MAAKFSPGSYWMTNIACGFAQKEGKSPYFYIEGDITHQNIGGESKDVLSPAKRTIFLYTSDKALDNTMEKLQRVGFNGNWDKPAINDEAMVNGMWVSCDHEMYNRQPVEKWNLPGGAMEHTPANTDTIRKLQAFWKQRQGAPAKKSPPKPVAPPPIANDDPPRLDENGIPF